MTEIHRINAECEQYPGKVTIQRLEPLAKWSLANAKNPMELMIGELIEGCRPLVKVEGTDPTAEHLVKRLYGILTTRYGYQISEEDSGNSK